MERKDILTVNYLSSKFKSKINQYNLLIRECEIYLQPKQDSTQKFLKDIMHGKKLYLKCNKINVIKVPQYKGLRVKDLIKFAVTNETLMIICLSTSTTRS